MGYPRRHFVKGVPYVTLDHFVFRLELAKHPEVKRTFVELMCRYAEMCEVDIHGYAICPTHMHLCPSQDFTGLDPRAKVGIPAFMRNFKSQASRLLVPVHGEDGAKWKRRYRAHGLADPDSEASEEASEEPSLLDQLAYFYAQDIHHGMPSGSAHTSRDTLDGEPGAVTRFPPVFVPVPGASREERLANLGQALDDALGLYAQLRAAHPPGPEMRQRERDDHDRALLREALHTCVSQRNIRLIESVCIRRRWWRMPLLGAPEEIEPIRLRREPLVDEHGRVPCAWLHPVRGGVGGSQLIQYALRRQRHE